MVIIIYIFQAVLPSTITRVFIGYLTVFIFGILCSPMVSRSISVAPLSVVVESYISNAYQVLLDP